MLTIALPDLDDVARLSGAERDRAVMDIERACRQVRAFRAAVIGVVDTSQSYLDDSHHSTPNWWCGVTNTAKAAAVRDVRTARMLADMPHLRAAAENGDIGDEQLRLLSGLYANPRCRPQMPDSDAFLTAEARSMVFHDFALVCRQWELAADPDGAHRDHQASVANRHVTTVELGAGHRMIAEGDALSGATMREIIAAHTRAEYESDVADRLAEHGTDADQHPLRRTDRQRRYDALLEIFRKAAGTVDETNREPLVVIVSTAAEVQAAINELFGTIVPFAVGSDPAASGRLRLCQTSTGVPVDPHDLAVAAIFGRIRQIVIDPNGVVINLGRTSRIFTGSTRTAVLLCGRRCIGPGCHVDHHDIQIDHIRSWSDGGHTNQDNAAPMCGRTNRDKHTAGFTVRRDNTGWHWYRPDGTEICPRPPPAPSPAAEQPP